MYLYCKQTPICLHMLSSLPFVLLTFSFFFIRFKKTCNEDNFSQTRKTGFERVRTKKPFGLNHTQFPKLNQIKDF